MQAASYEAYCRNYAISSSNYVQYTPPTMKVCATTGVIPRTIEEANARAINSNSEASELDDTVCEEYGPQQELIISLFHPL